MIKPTVGRIVYYWPQPGEMSHVHEQPFAAQITHVWGQGCVNLSILNENGVRYAKTSVMLAQDRPAVPGECGWMDYQVTKAAQEPHLQAVLGSFGGGDPVATPPTPTV